MSVCSATALQVVGCHLLAPHHPPQLTTHPTHTLPALQGMGISAEAGAAALQEIHRCFDEVGQLLADGRPFLCGDRFTAADITFAALAAPAVGQPYAAAPGLSEQTPPAMRTEIEQLRAHPAGQFALRLWREQRAVVVPAVPPSSL